MINSLIAKIKELNILTTNHLCRISISLLLQFIIFSPLQLNQDGNRGKELRVREGRVGERKTRSERRSQEIQDQRIMEKSQRLIMR